MCMDDRVICKTAQATKSLRHIIIVIIVNITITTLITTLLSLLLLLLLFLLLMPSPNRFSLPAEDAHPPGECIFTGWQAKFTNRPGLEMGIIS